MALFLNHHLVSDSRILMILLREWMMEVQGCHGIHLSPSRQMD
jgi:hypothetical protein